MFSKEFEGELVTESSANALAHRLATDVAIWLQDAVDSRGIATLVVSGGSTPAPFFASLAVKDIDWSRVKVTLADERWVAPDDALSNERLIRETLLTKAAAQATFVSLYNGAGTANEGWSDCDKALQQLPRPFDVVVLGMGGDGHTASLFPETQGLQKACDLSTEYLCWPMQPSHIEEERMTMTLAALLDSGHLILHITGKDKQEVFNNALTGTNLPIASVITPSAKRLKVYWSE